MICRAAIPCRPGRAREREIDPRWHDYLDTGSGSELSRLEAEQAWQGYRFRPRALRMAGEVSTAVEILGARLQTPVLVAATAFHRLYADGGEAETAAGPWWMQVYLTRERRAIEGLVAEAADLGAGALVLTVDTPMVARRARGQAAFDAVPLPWQLTNLGRHLPDGADRVHAIAQCPTSLDGIQRFAEFSGLPVLVDGGIRSSLDVLAALALGADAVLLGRPVVWGLAADGARGVAAVLDGVTEDLREALTLLGVASPGEVESDDVVLTFT